MLLLSDIKRYESESLLSRVQLLQPQSPWNSPGQNTGVGSHSLPQGIFPTQGPNPDLPHCRQILYQLSYQGGPSKGMAQPKCNDYSHLKEISSKIYANSQGMNLCCLGYCWLSLQTLLFFSQTPLQFSFPKTLRKFFNSVNFQSYLPLLCHLL